MSQRVRRKLEVEEKGRRVLAVCIPRVRRVPAARGRVTDGPSGSGLAGRPVEGKVPGGAGRPAAVTLRQRLCRRRAPLPWGDGTTADPRGCRRQRHKVPGADVGGPGPTDPPVQVPPCAGAPLLLPPSRQTGSSTELQPRRRRHPAGGRCRNERGEPAPAEPARAEAAARPRGRRSGSKTRQRTRQQAAVGKRFSI